MSRHYVAHGAARTTAAKKRRGKSAETEALDIFFLESNARAIEGILSRPTTWSAKESAAKRLAKIHIELGAITAMLKENEKARNEAKKLVDRIMRKYGLEESHGKVSKGTSHAP